MKNILVTGGKGQLATCIKDIAGDLPEFNLYYVDYEVLDITNKKAVFAFFEENKIIYCINCAAYTAVDKAESDEERAAQVNAGGAKFLAQACDKNNAIMIQISTDFVFEGNTALLYSEEDSALPLGAYGRTKLEGENAVLANVQEHFIIRTSWLYSEHGHNFLKTMLKLGNEREELSVVCDQIGTPTYAGDLAQLIVHLLKKENNHYGLYHYSNEGVASWYDFAKAIFEEAAINVKLLPIKSEAYPTPAKRPAFSVMDKTKIKENLNLEIPYWRDSLKTCLKKL